MKVVTNNKIVKIISLMLIAIIIVNSVMPIYSFADKDVEIGGNLFTPIFKLFAGVGDLVIKGLQKIFVGYGDIKTENLRKT